MRFSIKLSNLKQWSLLTTYMKSYMGFSKKLIEPLKSRMAEIRHLENRNDVIFLPISMKFGKLVQNDMSTAVIWSKLKPEV